MKASMKQITEGAMRFKQNICLNSCLPIVSIFLIALLFIPIAGNAGSLRSIVITSVPALGTPPTIGVGQSVVFTAEGKDQNGNTVPIPNPQWYSDGGHGTIVVDPNDPNKCTYTATNKGAAYIQCCDGPPGTGADDSKDFTTTTAGPPCTFNCGDGVCCKKAGEDKNTCCQDCGSCGDHACCKETESFYTCYLDCGGYCGDGCCQAGEDISTCPPDCGGGSVCGDGFCSLSHGENRSNCPQDCCCREKGVGEDISTYGDGTPDGLQSNIGSIPSATNTGYLTVEVISGCRQLEKIRTYTEASQGSDNDYDYPYGLVGFELPCNRAIIRVYFHDASDLSEYTYRNYGPMPPNFNNPQWYTLPGVTFGTVDIGIGGQTVAYAEFTLTDGALGDNTGVDGVIYGQGGPGISMPHDLPGSGDEVLSFDFW